MKYLGSSRAQYLEHLQKSCDSIDVVVFQNHLSGFKYNFHFFWSLYKYQSSVWLMLDGSLLI